MPLPCRYVGHVLDRAFGTLVSGVQQFRDRQAIRHLPATASGLSNRSAVGLLRVGCGSSPRRLSDSKAVVVIARGSSSGGPDAAGISCVHGTMATQSLQGRRRHEG
jgi:hypothetical protein